MPCFVYFLNFPCNKNDQKWKVLRMPWKFNTIFSEYLRIFGANNINGGAPGGHNPPGRASTPRRALVGAAHLEGPLTYFFLPHHSIHPEKNTITLSVSHVLAPETVNFDLFARSSVSETISGICCLVCDSSMCPISFCFSGLYFE